jgi:hypothetical protein
VLGRRKRRGQASNEGAEAFRDLRAMALGAVAAGLDPPAPEHPSVSGLVVDIPADGGYATIVALTDDTTSLYTSTGGGTIGAGDHSNVAAATHGALVAVEAQLASFNLPDDQALPPASVVGLHVLTPSVNRMADVPVAAFWGEEEHELLPVIAAVQDVLSAVRTASGA